MSWVTTSFLLAAFGAFSLVLSVSSSHTSRKQITWVFSTVTASDGVFCDGHFWMMETDALYVDYDSYACLCYSSFRCDHEHSSASNMLR